MSAVLVMSLALALDPWLPARADPPPVPAGPAVFLGPDIPPELRNSRTVALTFDDGPSAYTATILQVLRRNRVPATFCLLGDNVARYPTMARRISRAGHQLCNHSRTHLDMARATPERNRREIAAAQRQIRRATGVTPRIFRFPYGSSDRAARKTLQGYGLRPLGWDVDPRDWTRPAAPARTCTARNSAEMAANRAHRSCQSAGSPTISALVLA